MRPVRRWLGSQNGALTPKFELDAGYTIQAAYYMGISNEDLQLNTYYVNGAQFYEIPLHAANAGLGYTNRPGALVARIDSYYVGSNNGFNRPAYWYANANVAKTVGPLTLNLGINNLFNSAAGGYGLIGSGSPAPQNQYGGANASAFAQGAEEFYLPYRQTWLTATFRL